jgi:DNA-binding FadR family transcriptional regulator
MHSDAVERLGIAIVSGVHPVGSALPVEAELGDWLGASRTVVREATKVLAAKGMLRSRPKVGTVVLDRANWDVLDPQLLRWMLDHGPMEDVIRDITEVRLIIEPAAARLAAERRTPQDADDVARLVAAMGDALDDDDAYVAADLAFHSALLALTANATLVRLAGAIGAGLRASRQLSVHAPGGPASAMAEHQAVADAVIAGRPDDAERAMRDLIVLTGSHLGLLLRNRRESGSVEQQGPV